jgi:protein-S-isoprenylcysteine O-methyltransferase Ste14
MYMGFNLLTISSMIYSMHIIIFLSGIFSIIVYHLIILAEEQFLEDRFGFEYANYKKKIRRYL